MRSAILTKKQQAAVELGDGAHLITAPPGSGKTEVLVRRVIYLIERSPRELFRILALTYTRKAAKELEERVHQMVSERNRWKINATTFHSFGLKLLQRYGKSVGIRNPITVISNVEDKRLLVTPLLEDMVGPVASIHNDHWKSLFNEIALRKTNLEPPDHVDGDMMLGGHVSLHDAYEAYEMALLNTSSIDYEGMIYQTINLLKTDPWVVSHLRRQYRHILVDEGQELTQGQYELLKILRSDTKKNFFVVADTDQAINAYAGGGPIFLEQFIQDFAANEQRLTTNFRSAKSIVNALNSLRGKIGTKALPPYEPSDSDSTINLAKGWVGAYSYIDEKTESTAITKSVKKLLVDGLRPEWVYKGETTKVRQNDICLLGRTGYALNNIAAELRKHEIPVVLSTEQGALFGSTIGRTGYYLLKLADNPNDISSKRFVFSELSSDASTPKENIGDPEIVWNFLRDNANRGSLPQGFAEIFLSPDGPPATDLELVRRLSNIEITLDNTEEAVAWHGDQQLIARLLDEYEVKMSSSNRSMAGFLRMIYEMEQAPSSKPGVRALTPHRARGLGFKVVIVLGMREGNFPHYRAKTRKELDEERRVVYVAASRAARALLFTRPRQRQTRSGEFYSVSESRYINEMGLTMDNL